MTGPTQGRGQPPAYTWGQKALFLLGLVGLCGSIVHYAQMRHSRPWEMAVAAASCVAVMLLSGVHQVNTFKVGSLEFQIREAQRVTAEANASLEQLRSLARLATRVLSPLVAFDGLYGAGLSDAEKARIRKDAHDALAGLGLNPDSIAKELRTLDLVLRYRVVVRLQDELMHAIGGTDATKAGTVGAAFKALYDFDSLTVPSAPRCRQFLEEHKVESMELTELLHDLTHLEETGEMRRSLPSAPNPST